MGSAHPKAKITQLTKVIPMFRQLRPAVMMLVVLTFITGVVYPLLVTAVAQVFFPRQANGSLIPDGAKDSPARS